MKLVYILIAVCIVALLLYKQTEGFQSEDRMNPEEFSYHLLQAVKGPIKRLSSVVLDLPMWKERFTLASMTPVELARYQLRKTEVAK